MYAADSWAFMCGEIRNDASSIAITWGANDDVVGICRSGAGSGALLDELPKREHYRRW